MRPAFYERHTAISRNTNKSNTVSALWAVRIYSKSISASLYLRLKYWHFGGVMNYLIVEALRHPIGTILANMSSYDKWYLFIGWDLCSAMLGFQLSLLIG